ncbi:glutaredoxin [Kribbella antiqua]|uniref:Glutaredoxin n=1 Tax=Kribbella antiqua TaxID=2512217 RepID=A0A4R2IUM1_9ACTN|nr:glutaredoxin family protein [Kribbella antiqua]TCO49263.1 glutaredoxin [Kribbella antiqua]
MSRVTLYTKPGCHLCEDARAIVVKVCAELGEEWTEVDITQDQALFSEYGDQIPVTFVDGKQHDFWRVDPVRLRTALMGTQADEARPGLMERLRRRRGQ